MFLSAGVERWRLGHRTLIWTISAAAWASFIATAEVIYACVTTTARLNALGVQIVIYAMIILTLEYKPKDESGLT